MSIPRQALFAGLASLGLSVVGGFATSAQAATNLVMNGGFETNGGPGWVENSNPAYPSIRYSSVADWVNNCGACTTHDQNATGWGFTQVQSIADLNSQNSYDPKLWGASLGYQNGNGFHASNNGGYFISSDGFDNRTPFLQTISGLEIGAEYTLNFEYAHAQEPGYVGATWQYWNVSFGTESYNTPTVNLPYGGFNGWNNSTHTFKASATTQALSFLAYGTNGLPPYLLLDGVNLTKVDPVPGPLPVLGAAGVLGWSRKLRRRIQTTGRRQVGTSKAISNS